jgi:hypothetical protein
MATIDGTVTLDLVGARLSAMNAVLRDLQQRVTGLGTRLGALEARFPRWKHALPALRDASAFRRSA